MSEKHDPYSSLRFQRFRRFLIASALVRMGTAAQGLAIGWEMYDRTGQALSLGLVGLVQAIPMLLFTLPAGYLADVFDRRKLMMLSLAGATLTSLGLAVFSWYQFPTTWMYALLFLDSSLLRIGSPAQRAITPLLVPNELFENAAKWSTSLMQITGIAGPAIGGFIIAFNIQAAYVLSAFSSLGFILFLTTMTLPPAPRSEHGNMFGQIAEGLRYVHDQKLLLGAISLDLFAVLLGGAVYLLPIFARDIIDLETVGLSPEAPFAFEHEYLLLRAAELLLKRLALAVAFMEASKPSLLPRARSRQRIHHAMVHCAQPSAGSVVFQCHPSEMKQHCDESLRVDGQKPFQQ